MFFLHTPISALTKKKQARVALCSPVVCLASGFWHDPDESGTLLKHLGSDALHLEDLAPVDEGSARLTMLHDLLGAADVQAGDTSARQDYGDKYSVIVLVMRFLCMCLFSK